MGPSSGLFLVVYIFYVPQSCSGPRQGSSASTKEVSGLLILDYAPTCIAYDFGLFTCRYLGSQLRVLDCGTGGLEIEDNQTSLDGNYIQGLQRP